MPEKQNIDSREALIAAIAQGLKPEYIFFWQPDGSGALRSEYLSQWYPAPFVVDEITYPTAEHYMMAEKARIFSDDGIRNAILRTYSPETVKKLGRMVRGFNSATWEQYRFYVVVRGNIAKFGQNPELKQFLVETGEKILVEASPYDQIWGVGLGEDDPRIVDPKEWNGKNLLGFALMAVRAKLIEG